MTNVVQVMHLTRERKNMSHDTLTHTSVIARRKFLRDLSGGLILSSITTSAGFSILSSFAAIAQEKQTSGDLPPSMKGDVLYGDVAKWSEFPSHQTGTPGDLATGDWMAERLKSAGLEVEFQAYSLPLFFLEKSALIMNDRAVECFPVWIPAATGAAPVTGPIVSFSSDAQSLEDYAGKIVLFSADDVQKAAFQSNAVKMMQAGAVGLIVVALHPAGVVEAWNNAPPFNRRPLPRPAVLVGASDFERLRQAASAGQTASIQIMGEFRAEGAARNVIGRIDRKKNRWMIVSTPASGWFRCAGERGCGVALFLGLAKWASSLEADCNWLFCATSGHELAHAGMLFLMASGALPEPKTTVCFLSLGASVAAREWEKVGAEWHPLSRLSRNLELVSTPNLANTVGPAFASILQVKATDKPEGGELHHVMSKGYRACGLFGSHLWFHTRRDGPETTDSALLESVSSALVKSLTKLLQQN
jgi:hypothetical protein